jgi:micrococcal nuclease
MPDFDYPATVVRVVDGDTLELSLDLGFHIYRFHVFRLAGIDAPEMRGETWQEGIESRRALVEMVSVPVGLRCITRKDKQGKYGRYLAILMNEHGDCINDLMVQGGHAVRKTYAEVQRDA